MVFRRLVSVILISTLPIAGFSFNDEMGKREYPFKVGERLVFSLFYNFIKAGWATLETVSIETIDSNPVFHATMESHSEGIIDRFYRIRDKFESWIDINGLFSRKFSKSLSEGRYKKKYTVYFDYDNLLAYSSSDTISITTFMHDPISIFHYVRADSLWIGKSIDVSNFDNDEIDNYKIVVESIEVVKVPAGEFECFLLNPVKDEGDLFKYRGRAKVYLSNNPIKLPVKIVGSAIFGLITMNLERYERVY